MARGDEGRDEKQPGPKGAEGTPAGRPPGKRRERLTPGEVWKLIMGTYKVSLPYLLVFLAGLLLATWILTELVF